MDKLISTGNGGFPLVLDDLRWMHGQIAAPTQGIIPAIDNMLRSHGDNFIIQGCVVTGSNPTKSMTEGWIMLSGEVVKVDPISATLDTSVFDSFAKNVGTDSRGSKEFQSGASGNVFEKNRGTITVLGGTLNVLTSDRLSGEFDQWVVEDISASNKIKTNSSPAGTGTDSNLVALTSSNFRYRIVGKTVHWNFEVLGATAVTDDVNDSFSFTIDTPFSVKVNSSAMIEAASTTAAASTGAARCRQIVGTDKMVITIRSLSSTFQKFSRTYAFPVPTANMIPVQTGASSVQYVWDLAGSGTWELA